MSVVDERRIAACVPGDWMVSPLVVCLEPQWLISGLIVWTFNISWGFARGWEISRLKAKPHKHKTNDFTIDNVFCKKILSQFASPLVFSLQTNLLRPSLQKVPFWLLFWRKQDTMRKLWNLSPFSASVGCLFLAVDFCHRTFWSVHTSGIYLCCLFTKCVTFMCSLNENSSDWSGREPSCQHEFEKFDRCGRSVWRYLLPNSRFQILSAFSGKTSWRLCSDGPRQREFHVDKFDFNLLFGFFRKKLNMSCGYSQNMFRILYSGLGVAERVPLSVQNFVGKKQDAHAQGQNLWFSCST